MKTQLPNTFILGAQKSGTTTLADILREHSEIFVPNIKEPHFYDNDYNKGLEWYQKEFYSDIENQKKVVIDATPSYLFFEEIPKRIFESQGIDLKFIVILRNPAKRAYSHYLMSLRNGYEKYCFDEAIEKEKQRSKNLMGRRKNSYISRGYYHKQINEYLKYYEHNQFHFIIFEEFVANQDKEITRLLNFLEVDITEDLDINKKSNARHEIRSKKIVRSIQFVSAFFRKINAKPKILLNLKQKLVKMNSKMGHDTKTIEPNYRSLNRRYYMEEFELLAELIHKDVWTYWEI